MRCTVMPNTPPRFQDRAPPETPEERLQRWRDAVIDVTRCIRSNFPQISEIEFRSHSAVVDIPENLQQEVRKKCVCIVIPDFDFDNYPPQQGAKPGEVAESDEENADKDGEEDAEA